MSNITVIFSAPVKNKFSRCISHLLLITMLWEQLKSDYDNRVSVSGLWKLDIQRCSLLFDGTKDMESISKGQNISCGNSLSWLSVTRG